MNLSTITLQDCMDLYKEGKTVVICDGQVKSIAKEK